MPPNKSKRPCREESPESDRCSKKLKQDDYAEEEEEKTQDGERSKAEGGSTGPNGLRSPGPSAHNKPAELFRKDLISAMKLADSEPLLPEEYLLISDPWKQEWEKGVQVPVNKEGIPDANIIEKMSKDKTVGDFKIPKKFLHAMKDDNFQLKIHEFTGMQQLAEQVVRYDLDDMDVTWLNIANDEREENGEIIINEWIMERVIEALESQCHEKMATKKKTEEGLGIEYDEDVVCEVCRSPESEDNNEMVFCDGCDICVHQACYGIQKIPEGSWLCRVCAMGIKPTCILCPKTGGAMKSTRSGTKWAHVSCALWIPEVTIGCAEKMEPITKISQIPASRWALICCICKDRQGACIQCSVKACKTAFHVTCAFSNSLEMKTVLTHDVADDGIKLKGYCPRHSRKGERRNSESDTDSPRKSISGSPRKELTDEEIAKMRAEKLKELEEEFYKEVETDSIAESLQVEPGAVEMIAAYWKLKRKTMFDAPLLTPKTEEEDLLEKQQEDSLIARMKMFVQLRQDLERVRNLCYMVSKREKIKKQYYKIREATFMGQVRALTDKKNSLSEREAKKIINQYHHDSIYDQECLEKILSSFKVTVPEDIVKSEDHMSQETQDNNTEEDKKLVMDITDTESVTVTETSQKRSKYYRHRRQRKSLHSVHIVKEEAELEIDVVAELGKEDAMSESEKSDASSTVRNRRKEFSKDSVEEEKEHLKEEFPVRERRSKSSNYKKEDFDFVLSKVKKKPELQQNVIENKLERDTKTSVESSRSSDEEDKQESDRKTLNLSPDDFLPSPRELRSVTKPLHITISPQKFKEVSKPTQDVNFHSKVNGKVSERIKAEISHYMRNSKLVIPDKVKDKVQKGLLNSASKSRLKYLNGVHGSSQRKIDDIFRRKSDIVESAVIKDGTVNGRNVSRVLNEISPSKTRHAGNTWYSASSSPKSSSLRGYRIPKKNEEHLSPKMDADQHKNGMLSHESSPGPETRSSRRRIDNSFDCLNGPSTRSSRENSPESVINLRSMQKGEVDRILTRASSPASSFRSLGDAHSDFIDVENVFHDGEISTKRVTRSQLSADSENSRDSTDSRRSFVRSLMS